MDMSGTQGRVIWITGLSGAGKTTLAQALKARLPSSILLDGDELRSALGAAQQNFDYAARKALAHSYAQLAGLLAKQGFTIIIATISLFHDIHKWNRENLPNYLEIFLDISPELRKARDPKGLYKLEQLGKIGNMAGSGVKVEFPLSPHIKFSDSDSLDCCIKRIIEKLD